MTGWLKVVGVGPGDPRWVTPETWSILESATDLVGYGPYLDRVPVRAGQARHESDNRQEIARARHALALALDGHKVALVSGGDPGVFAMASAVFEAIDEADPDWRRLEVEVSPGITAMQAAASRLGAPLGHDFCAISLSDNLKPWGVIEARLRLAAEADFVIALYNAASRARPDLLPRAFAIIGEVRAPATPVAFARAVGRPDEAVRIVTLADTAGEEADMRTLVLIGSSQTRLIARDTGQAWLYTPRTYPSS